LSDSARDFRKFRIPDGTFLAAGGYRVFYEAQFNSGGPGSFSFDSVEGGQVFLSEADATGNLSGYRAAARVGPAASGVSFGRFEAFFGVGFPGPSQRAVGQDGAMSLVQFRTGAGLFNAGPAVGPVVINEIMYHPPGIGGGTNDNSLDEYIELHNVTQAAVP